MARTACKILGVVFVLVGLIGYAAPNLMGMHLTGIHNIIHLISGALALYFGFAASYSMARTFCIIFGAVYLLIGVLGFIAPDSVAALLQMREMPGMTGSLVPDNIVHILLGAVFLIAAFIRATDTTPIGSDHGNVAHG
ncbi:MAG TPA: DUF4383 domain-containing protein [Blastocatellia bacterium]|nr:DUF4383 domain-containing protein [Blastocatellia bacterium]